MAKLFRNYTNEGFSWKWDGVPYDFPAGREMYLEDHLADHFAKHLVNRELTKDMLQVNDVKRAEYLAKVLEVVETNSDTPGDAQIADMNAKMSTERKEEIGAEIKADEKGSLQQLCEVKGIDYDKRWGADKLRAALEEAPAAEEKTEEFADLNE